MNSVIGEQEMRHEGGPHFALSVVNFAPPLLARVHMHSMDNIKKLSLKANECNTKILVV